MLIGTKWLTLFTFKIISGLSLLFVALCYGSAMVVGDGIVVIKHGVFWNFGAFMTLHYLKSFMIEVGWDWYANIVSEAKLQWK